MQDSSFFGYDYFCGANVYIKINGLPALEAAGISYQVQDSTAPIYGYSSRIFDAIAIGQKMIRGSLIINFIQPHYIATLIERGRGLAVASKLDVTAAVTKANASTGEEFEKGMEEMKKLKRYIAMRENAYAAWDTSNAYQGIAESLPIDNVVSMSGVYTPSEGMAVKFQKDNGQYMNVGELLELHQKAPFLFSQDQISGEILSQTGLDFHYSDSGAGVGETNDDHVEWDYQPVTNFTDHETHVAQGLAARQYEAAMADFMEMNHLQFGEGTAEQVTGVMGEKGLTFDEGRLNATSREGWRQQKAKLEAIYNETLKGLMTNNQASLAKSNADGVTQHSYIDAANNINTKINALKTADTHSSEDIFGELAALEQAHTDFYTSSAAESLGVSDSITTDIGLMGPFNIDISFAKKYTIRIIDAFFTSRGSMIQIDESAIVEEYSFFARDIKSVKG